MDKTYNILIIGLLLLSITGSVGLWFIALTLRKAILDFGRKLSVNDKSYIFESAEPRNKKP